MQRRRWRAARYLAMFASASLVFAACSSSGASPGASGGGSVTVIGTWGGDEEASFKAMVAPFEARTGIKVNYTGTRDINAVLTTGVASGVLPDLAGLPGPGQMQEYAKAGKLIDLSTILDVNTYKSQTATPLVDLGTVDGKIVGVFIKSAVKGLMWYNPKTVDFATAPTSWDALKQALTTNASKAQSQWCVGLESGAASGWPGTDWIEDIVLRQAGPDVYNQWWQGKVTWTDPKIKSAWQVFGDVIANASGGANSVLTTAFQTGGDGLFASPPNCLLHHQASFITGLGAFKDKPAGTDYNFFPFPDIDPAFTGAVEGAGDLFGMFKDTPQSRELMKYLVSAEAQAIWVGRGGALSANKQVTNYPDDIAKRSAALLTGAKIFAFDASDLMPEAMNNAFWSGILDFVKDPSKLDAILANLDTVQKDAYAT